MIQSRVSMQPTDLVNSRNYWLPAKAGWVSHKFKRFCFYLCLSALICGPISFQGFVLGADEVPVRDMK